VAIDEGALHERRVDGALAHDLLHPVQHRDAPGEVAAHLPGVISVGRIESCLPTHCCLPAGPSSQRLVICGRHRMRDAWRSAAREACELRGRPVEHLGHGLIPEGTGYQSDPDGWDLVLAPALCSAGTPATKGI
jgi:hypothetical protein